ncbi:MAG: hypothetical protein ABI333_12755 [bacterium]
MDGYTYMIERNRLLIRLEAERRGRAGGQSTSEAAAVASGDKQLRQDLMTLYADLEACGRGERPS